MTDKEADTIGRFISGTIVFTLYCFSVGWMIHGFFSDDIHELCIGGLVAMLLNVNSHHAWVKKRLSRED